MLAPTARRRRTVLSVLAASLVATFPAPLHAQGVQIERAADSTKAKIPDGRFSAVVDGMVVRSEGEFAQYVDGGLGVGGAFLLSRSGSSALALRIEAGFVGYGRETKQVPFYGSGGRVLLDMTTSNDILLFGVGPQLMATSGAVRPYVAGTVGVAGFLTSTDLTGSGDTQSFGNTNNQGDATFAWTTSAGVFIPMQRGRNAWSFDIGATYHGNGTATYLRHGDILDNPTGPATLNPITSQTRFVSFRIGVRIGA